MNIYISDYLYSINCECCGLKTRRFRSKQNLIKSEQAMRYLQMNYESMFDREKRIMSTYMTLEEYTATLKVGDEVTIKYYSITGEKEIKEKILKITKNGQCCCENWGYLSSEDDFGSFIGSELKNVYVTDSELGTIVSNMKEDLDAGSAMFINVETTRGLLQFAAYNEHNGYYGHDVRLVSKYDDKTVIEADDVL